MLTREHIIPYSLGGQLVIPKASCREHAKLTSRLELKVARELYGRYRALEGAPTRRKSRTKKKLKEIVTVRGEDRAGKHVTAQIPASEALKFHAHVQAWLPGILRDPDIKQHEHNGVDISLHADDESSSKLLRKLQWRSVWSDVVSIKPDDFMRVLAKIAHSFACAELGCDSFRPTVLDYIFNEGVDGLHYVGGFDPQQNQSERPLLLKQETHNGKRLVIVEISLHFYPRMPRYQVVCGSLD